MFGTISFAKSLSEHGGKTVQSSQRLQAFQNFPQFLNFSVYRFKLLVYTALLGRLLALSRICARRPSPLLAASCQLEPCTWRPGNSGVEFIQLRLTAVH